MRQLNDMFHIDREQLVKTSNNEPIPEGEPVFILRARDRFSAQSIAFYIELCQANGVPHDRLQQLEVVKEKFLRWSNVKTPGSTHGK